MALQRFWVHVKRYNLTIDNMMYCMYSIICSFFCSQIKLCLKHACFSHLGWKIDFKTGKVFVWNSRNI